ncbi:MAG: hypothetical protein JXB18_15430 [Sedimentisphaerales bacterium]|nr:hypothetical protein [Sedimentisphaerales bacterium]
MKTVILHNGVEMPILGFGVYQIPDYEACKLSVLYALEVGKGVCPFSKISQGDA